MSDISARANIRVKVPLPIDFDRRVYTLLTGHQISKRQGRRRPVLVQNLSRDDGEGMIKLMQEKIPVERRATMNPEFMAIALILIAGGYTVLNERWSEEVRRKLHLSIRKTRASRQANQEDEKENDNNYVADIARYQRRLLGNRKEITKLEEVDPSQI